MDRKVKNLKGFLCDKFRFSEEEKGFHEKKKRIKKK